MILGLKESFMVLHNLKAIEKENIWTTDKMNTISENKAYINYIV